MNKTILSTGVAASLLLSQVSLAQNAKSQLKPQSVHAKVYEQAKALADFPTAIQAVHYLLAEAPEKNAPWKDSLALLYYQSGAYIQCYTLTHQMLQSGQPTDLRLELKGSCAKQLQQPLAGIEAYNQLFSKTSSAYYGFEQLQLEYGIRRLAEAVVTGTRVLNAIAPKDSTQISVLRKDGKTGQQVSLKAATCYTMALSYNDLKQTESAVASLNTAIAEAPDFDLANELLAKLKSADTAASSPGK